MRNHCRRPSLDRLLSESGGRGSMAPPVFDRSVNTNLNRLAPHFLLALQDFRPSYGPVDRLLILVSFASLCLPDRSSTILYAVCTYVLVVHYISHTKGPGSIQSPVCIPPQSLIVVFAKVDR